MKKAILTAVVISIGLAMVAAVSAIGGHPWKENPTLLRLKSNGEIVAELRLLKGTKTKVEMDGQIQYKQVGNIQRAILTNTKGDAQLRILMEGGKPVEIKADQIEFEMEAPEQLRR